MDCISLGKMGKQLFKDKTTGGDLLNLLHVQLCSENLAGSLILETITFG